jgi:hypothetical protein
MTTFNELTRKPRVLTEVKIQGIDDLQHLAAQVSETIMIATPDDVYRPTPELYAMSDSWRITIDNKEYTSLANLLGDYFMNYDLMTWIHNLITSTLVADRAELIQVNFGYRHRRKNMIVFRAGLFQGVVICRSLTMENCHIINRAGRHFNHLRKKCLNFSYTFTAVPILGMECCYFENVDGRTLKSVIDNIEPAKFYELIQQLVLALELARLGGWSLGNLTAKSIILRDSDMELDLVYNEVYLTATTVAVITDYSQATQVSSWEDSRGRVKLQTGKINIRHPMSEIYQLCLEVARQRPELSLMSYFVSDFNIRQLNELPDKLSVSATDSINSQGLLKMLHYMGASMPSSLDDYVEPDIDVDFLDKLIEEVSNIPTTLLVYENSNDRDELGLDEDELAEMFKRNSQEALAIYQEIIAMLTQPVNHSLMNYMWNRLKLKVPQACEGDDTYQAMRQYYTYLINDVMINSLTPSVEQYQEAEMI